MNPFSLIGILAAACTTLSFLPQAIKVIRSRHTRDLSFGMYAVFTVGVLLWLAYGILLRDYAMIVGNSVTLVLAGIILGMKLKYK